MEKNHMYSMTGYGRAEKASGDWQVLAEVKSLNGKQMEMNLKIPPLLKGNEFDIRNVIANRLGRGSIDFSITLKHNGSTKPVMLNTGLIRSYYQTLQELSDELKLDTTQVLGALLRLPEVVLPVTETVDDAGWLLVQEAMDDAINTLLAHRRNEGAILCGDLLERINVINACADEVAILAAKRPDYLRENLRKRIEEALGKDQYDPNRMEQEIIYYIEKYDISEELVRLKNHCDYFISLVKDEEISKGKRLGFLLQEIGREINTTGAKAYDAEMQKLVVKMKDELEKAKEQILNIL
jgi:uncharacterized protein (TIGR00255 family)